MLAVGGGVLSHMITFQKLVIVGIGQIVSLIKP